MIMGRGKLEKHDQVYNLKDGKLMECVKENTPEYLGSET